MRGEGCHPSSHFAPLYFFSCLAIQGRCSRFFIFAKTLALFESWALDQNTCFWNCIGAICSLFVHVWSPFKGRWGPFGEIGIY